MTSRHKAYGLHRMNFKKLGNTEILVPEIGLGTWNYKGGVEPLRAGIKLGASLIDTAEGYYTEDIVGEAVRPLQGRGHYSDQGFRKESCPRQRS